MHSRDSLNNIAIEDLAWLEGRWQGEIGEDPIEEQWSAPANGAMMGMFRWMRGESVRIYELILLRREGDEIMLRLKHFNRDLVALEEKDKTVEFVLVELRDEEAVFLERGVENPPWLLYRREGDSLTAWFEREPEPPRIQGVFQYCRS